MATRRGYAFFVRGLVWGHALFIFVEKGKRQMKRLIALLLTLVMVFALCACAGGGNAETTQPTEVEEEPAQEEIIEATPEPTPELGLSADDCIGNWAFDFEQSSGNAGFWTVMQISKGGTGKGFADDWYVGTAGKTMTAKEKLEENTGYMPMTWETQAFMFAFTESMALLSIVSA